MRTMAGAEPATEVAGLADGHASKMGAHACTSLASCYLINEGYVPSMINHSGFFTRWESGSGSRNASHLVSSASLISSSVRCRMKTGLPRHLIMTCSRQFPCLWPSVASKHTFLPSGMAARSTSTLA